MSGNFAGNIIAALAGLPDFLRKPILARRLEEFFTMGDAEREEVVANALDAGHALPFPVFAKLLETWLEALAAMPAGRRDGLFGAYVDQAASDPARLVPYNMDGLFGVFLGLEPAVQDAVARSLSGIIGGLGPEQRRRVMALVPDAAAARLGL